MPSVSSSVPLKWLVPLLLLLCLPDRQRRCALAFDFTYGPPTQCGPLNVSWSGGTAPFSLLITPLFNPSQNISIPTSSFDIDSQNGAFSIQLPLSAGQKFLLTMSDAEGFGTGGVSDVLTTGSSSSGADCNTTSTTPSFTFRLPNALQQCGDFLFDGYNGSVQPNTIQALIPLGQTFALNTDPDSNNFTWETNVAAGTSLVFIMFDSEGRSGGSSDLETVTASSDASCLNASSPHSTVTAASQTSAPHETQTVQFKSGVEPGAIAGIVLGTIALLLLVIIVAIFLLRRRKRKNEGEGEDESRPQIVQVGGGLSSTSSRLSRMRGSIVPTSRRRNQQSVDLITPTSAHASPYSTHLTSHYPLNSSHSLPSGAMYVAEPYQFPSNASAMDGHSSAPDTSTDVLARISHTSPGSYSQRISRSSHYNSQSDVPNSPADHPVRSNPHSRHPSLHQLVTSESFSPKGSVRYSTPRFILHTDAEDPSIVDEEELVELPPEYTDRREREHAQHWDAKQGSQSG